ncbi:hypothetical protein D3Z36_01815 [Lachnospiraceae bacterium]|nr:hypothetical protein [Lachnospiraceae bacterium]
MTFFNKIEKRYFAAFCYMLSLSPVLLPWCYFDKDMDGIKYGIDIVNNAVLLSLATVTIAAILSARKPKAKIVVKILLGFHFVVYFFCSFFWYVPLISDFDLRLSLESVHYGFYLSVLCNGLVYLLYRE